jgi:peptidoglycan/xylan/chitin deacetylase (PgdA/CDA1 family)
MPSPPLLTIRKHQKATQKGYRCWKNYCFPNVDGFSMNLISFSVRTKGLHNFLRRLWTVFTRFGFSEKRFRRALSAITDDLHQFGTAPTFFIPAVVLNRHPKLITEIARQGAEIGIHGYVHNDYRALTEEQQYQQTKKAIAVFKGVQIPHEGFRNPYLGWTDASRQVFARLGLAYESNDAVLHHVFDFNRFSPLLRSGFEKSLALFQAIPCTTYTLRPHLEGTLVLIPTSLPDDEMLFDRLRVTNPTEVGRIWSNVMRQVYKRGGIYTLNLHPERGVLCKPALDLLLATARNQPLPVWIARLGDVAAWWKARSQFTLRITPQAPGCWFVETTSSPRATVIARHLEVVDHPATQRAEQEVWISAQRFTVRAPCCPCLAVSPQTPQEVLDFLQEAGYPAVQCSAENARAYALYLELPEGLGATREQRIQRCSALVDQIEQMEAPFLRFGCWPDGNQAALSVTGDIDSVTIQDFFLRILEVSSHA